MAASAAWALSRVRSAPRRTPPTRPCTTPGVHRRRRPPCVPGAAPLPTAPAPYPAASGRVQPRELLRAECQVGRGGGVRDGGGAFRAGNGDHHRGLGELPGQRHLLRADTQLRGGVLEGRVVLGEAL